MIAKDILRHAAEFKRYLANSQYEETDGGILFPKASAVAVGQIVTTVNGGDERLDYNLFTTEGLNYLLDAGVHDGVKVSTFYVAPFSGNVTVLSTWTAANFTANSTEFTNYDEATRVEYVETAPASGSVNNTSNKADFTISAGGGTMWGAGLLSNSTKSGTTGTLLSAAKFTAARTLLETDVISFGYTLTLTSS